jgi:hypothetical protein
MLLKIKNKILLSLLVLSAFGAKSQEINANVNVTWQPNLPITTVDEEILKTLETVANEFLNNTRWTRDEFKIEERINCSFQITIKQKVSNGAYSGSLLINANRPIYNASISSTMINFLDEDFSFVFSREQIIQYSENQFRDNLTSMLAFWVYMILGYDYDSFSLLGGTPYFTLANQISTLAVNKSAGWSPNDNQKRNRYYIIDNHLNALFEPLRRAYYNYHRMGVDLLFSNPTEGRANILEAIKTLEAIQNANFGNVNLQIFTLAKRTEFVNIFSKAEPSEKTEVVAILKKIDPSNGEKYDEILKM